MGFNPPFNVNFLFARIKSGVERLQNLNEKTPKTAKNVFTQGGGAKVGILIKGKCE